MFVIYTQQTVHNSQSSVGMQKNVDSTLACAVPLTLQKALRWALQVLMTSLCLIIHSEILLSVQLFKTAKHRKQPPHPTPLFFMPFQRKGMRSMPDGYIKGVDSYRFQKGPQWQCGLSCLPGQYVSSQTKMLNA